MKEASVRKSILETAATFWEADRQEAFRTIYKAMRVVDDIVDDRKKEGSPIGEEERTQLQEKIQSLLEPADPPRREAPNALIAVRERFGLPSRCFDLWMHSMLYDLRCDGFDCWKRFREYAEGAAVSPGAIFLHLCALKPRGEGFEGPNFDIFAKARDLALFSYIVHILRDFRVDVRENLYFLDEHLLQKYGLDRQALQRIAQGGEYGAAFTEVLRKCVARGEQLRKRARATIDGLAANLEPRYRFSLEVVYDSYLAMFERIDVENPDLDRLATSVEEAAERLSTLYFRFWGKAAETALIRAALLR